MKIFSKAIIVFCLLTFTAPNCFSQTKLFDGLKGLNEFVDLIGKFFVSGSKVDSTINKEKVRNMVNELYFNVRMIIRDKEEIVYRIEKNQNYEENILSLQYEMNRIIETLKKYNPLIVAVGIDAEGLEADLRQDFLNPAKTIDGAINLFDNQNVGREKIKQTLLTYFKSCINIMKTAQSSLEDYNKQNGKK